MSAFRHTLTALCLLHCAAACGQVRLQPIGIFQHGDIDRAAAEIVAFDAQHARLAVINGQAQALDLLDIRAPGAPKLWKRISLAEFGGIPTSVAVSKSVIAVAVCGDRVGTVGTIALLTLEGEPRARVCVGYHPDMVTFTPDGTRLLVANEGEPSPDYAIDPVGSISLIDVNRALLGDSQAVCDLAFERFNHVALDKSIRVFGPGASPSQDFEPEFVAVAPQGQIAMVTLQENNAVAIVDLVTQSITDVVGLGFKDHRVPGNGLDANDQDGKQELHLLPVWGMYQPDAIAAFDVGGNTFFVTANEGDVRYGKCYSEIARCSELALDDSFAATQPLLTWERLGRLQVTRTLGDNDGDGRHEALYTFGARSFAIWNDRAELIYDSGDLLERTSLELFPQEFNSNNDGNSLDDRSDDRGPEPEGVTVGKVGDRTLAFLGLERPSAIFVIDVTNPAVPQIVSVYHDSLQSRAANDHTPRDRGPEGLCFISADQSPTGKPLLAVAFEVSGTTRVFEVVQRFSD